MHFNSIMDADLNGKRVLVRLDLNVPVQDGQVTDFTRIDRVKDTITHLRGAGAKTIILSHFGRPKGVSPKESLAFLPAVLAQRWGGAVAFAPACVGDVARTTVDAMKPGDVLLLENVRFHEEEEANDMGFAKQLAALGDVYVNDAFSVSHRAHASVHALATCLPAYAGLAMQAELLALDAALGRPKRPVMAVVGGAKISTKLDLLKNLVGKVDRLVLGGGMANTFLVAKGWAPQASLHEPDMLDTARAVMEKAEETGCQIILPIDMMAAEKFDAHAPHHVVELDDMPPRWMALDIGPETVAVIEDILSDMETVLWNGPLGAFELPPFAAATIRLAQAVATHTTERGLISVAGGGDTVAALSVAGCEAEFTYISAAGGAFLEWLEGKTLPGVAVLDKQAKAA